jgi:hypothetical protein
MKYWQIILENLRNAGWNCGCIATTDGKGRPIWIVAAQREDAGRFIVEADQDLPAFLELESAIPPLFLGAQQFSDSSIRELLL